VRLATGPARPATGRTSLAPRTSVRLGAGRLNSIDSHLSSGQASEGSGHDTADEERSASPILSDPTDTLSPKHLRPQLSRTFASDRLNAPSTNSTRSTASPVAQRSTAGSTAASREVEDLVPK
jgi:dynactin 1